MLARGTLWHSCECCQLLLEVDLWYTYILRSVSRFKRLVIYSDCEDFIFFNIIYDRVLQASRHVGDLFEDLRDGHNLISLLEVLSGEHLVSKLQYTWNFLYNYLIGYNFFWYYVYRYKTNRAICRNQIAIIFLVIQRWLYESSGEFIVKEKKELASEL